MSDKCDRGLTITLLVSAVVLTPLALYFEFVPPYIPFIDPKMTSCLLGLPVLFGGTAITMGSYMLIAELRRKRSVKKS